MLGSDALPILIADDDDAYVRFVCEILADVKGQRFAVEHVRYLSRILPALEARKANVLLLDVQLPDGNGLEWLRANRPGAGRGCRHDRPRGVRRRRGDRPGRAGLPAEKPARSLPAGPRDPLRRRAAARAAAADSQPRILPVADRQRAGPDHGGRRPRDHPVSEPLEHGDPGALAAHRRRSLPFGVPRVEGSRQQRPRRSRSTSANW
jgi:hypothetical protein